MDQKELKKIIKKEEGQFIEFKSSFSDAVIETAVAFANKRGGKIIIGVNDVGKVAGVSVSKESVPKWLNEIKHKTYPYLTPDIEVFKIGNKKIVILDVVEFPIKPVAFKSKYFIRKNNSNHIIPLQEVAEMYLRARNTSWDYYPYKKYSLQDLDIKKIEKVKTMIEKNLNINLGDSFSFLKKYDLIISEDGIKYPTHAAVLLFAKQIPASADIQIGLFQTDTIIKKDKLIKTDLITALDEVMDFIKAYILREFVFTGKLQREERWQYPIKAIREFVINAVVHKDYQEGTHTQIKVFSDKIVFWNIGKLPYGLTIENIEKGEKKSHPRNKLIVEIFRDCGLIERYGSGVKRSIDAFMDYGLSKPIIKEVQGGVDIVVFGKKVTENQKKVDKISSEKGSEKGSEKSSEKIIALINTDKNISIKELSLEIGLTTRAVEKNIKKLKEKGVLQRVGPDKGGYWKVVDRKEETDQV